MNAAVETRIYLILIFQGEFQGIPCYTDTSTIHPSTGQGQGSRGLPAGEVPVNIRTSWHTLCIQGVFGGSKISVT